MIESMPAPLDNQISQHASKCSVNDRQTAIAFENAFNYGTAINDRDKGTEQRLYLDEQISAEFGEIVGDSPSLIAALNLVSVVAPTDSSVLILGETGTGKELVARATH